MGYIIGFLLLLLSVAGFAIRNLLKKVERYEEDILLKTVFGSMSVPIAAAFICFTLFSAVSVSAFLKSSTLLMSKSKLYFLLNWSRLFLLTFNISLLLPFLFFILVKTSWLILLSFNKCIPTKKLLVN